MTWLRLVLAAWVILAGSLPVGLDDATYASLIAALKPTGAKIFLDTSGTPLTEVLKSDAMPHCIKPNRAELAEFCGHPLPTHRDLIDVAPDAHIPHHTPRFDSGNTLAQNWHSIDARLWTRFFADRRGDPP